MEKLKKQFVWMMLVVMALQLVTVKVSTAFAASAGDIVINEIAWAGSADGSNDEWIELYNTTSQSIDLAGWTIDDDNGASTLSIESGVIAPHGYFLIEDSEVAVNSIDADALIGMSLANTGDSLVLKDNSDADIDIVNSTGGSWYAGDSSTKATMERIDPNADGDSQENWASTVSGNGAIGRDGAAIIGTPRGPNSNYGGTGPSVQLQVSDNNPSSGDSITVSALVNDGDDIFAYGMEINYDPAILNFVESNEADFLNSDGESTAFYSALENGQEGTLLVGNARLTTPASGISGNGQLFSVVFDVIAESSDSTDIVFAGSSFLADVSGDVPVSFDGASITVGDGNVDPGDANPVANLEIAEGNARYALALGWDSPEGGADTYIVRKQLADGSYVMLGETADLSFIDDDTASNGGDLVPNVEYTYQVIAVNNGVQSVAVSATAVETRGITGDNNRSDRVDGRDVERLARSFGTELGSENYDPLKDTTFDGIIDGSDLIDIGANFGLTY